jgi:hypothetical protein
VVACRFSVFDGADRWLSGQKQQTVNLPAHVAYGGSNPPLSTSSVDDAMEAAMSLM